MFGILTMNDVFRIQLVRKLKDFLAEIHYHLTKGKKCKKLDCSQQNMNYSSFLKRREEERKTRDFSKLSTLLQVGYRNS